jgi:hypothetical protein
MARREALRREAQVGDVFALRGRKLLGRVVSTTAVVGPTHGCALVYVYRDATLSRDALLVPPLLTTRAPWYRGLFEHRESRPLMPGDYFAAHVFRDAQGRLFDEEERPLDSAPPGVPVGEHRLLDVDAVADAIAAVPGEYEPPPLREPTLEAVRAAARALVQRWTADRGRPPTRAEWASLYEPEGPDEE